jgi:hypothetical protein
MSTDTPGNPAARELGYCPCCGYRTLPEEQPGSYEVCPVSTPTSSTGTPIGRMTAKTGRRRRY